MKLKVNIDDDDLQRAERALILSASIVSAGAILSALIKSNDGKKRRKR